MQKRRLRPVAALTLAVVAAPFLAATAVAAQAQVAPPKPAPVAAEAAEAAEPAGLESLSWPTKVVRLVELATTGALTRPAPAVPAAVTPPPPPPVSDPAHWIWPGNGPITSPFGSRWGRPHEGVDIDAAYGSAVVAAQRGTVIEAGWGMSGYGRVVRIDHGEGLTTLYAHLSSVNVAVGQVVAQGHHVGNVGASGSVTAAHLHYEVRRNGAPLNPASWLPAQVTFAGNPG